MAVATQTANGEFSFDETFDGKPLGEWVRLVHQEFSKFSGWKYFPLKPGQFGFDNMAMSIGFSFRSAERDETAIAKAVHEGWRTNYWYWLTNKPSFPYFGPRDPLGDERRNACARAEFENLPNDEKEKDLAIAKIILSMR